MVVADAIRAQGYVVHTMAEVYPDGRDEDVRDFESIRDADVAGWVALTKDERITRYPEEQEALARSSLRVFAIGNQHLTGPEMAAYYVTKHPSDRPTGSQARTLRRHRLPRVDRPAVAEVDSSVTGTPTAQVVTPPTSALCPCLGRRRQRHGSIQALEPWPGRHCQPAPMSAAP